MWYADERDVESVHYAECSVSESEIATYFEQILSVYGISFEIRNQSVGTLPAMQQAARQMHGQRVAGDCLSSLRSDGDQSFPLGIEVSRVCVGE
jgi:hypothetical protein